MRRSIELVQFDRIEQIREVAEEWDRLWHDSEVTLPTARAELVAAWLEHFAPRAALRGLVVRQDGRMVAALPLVGQRRRRLLPVGDLTWNYWSPNGELLLDPAADAEAVLDRLAGAVATLPWPLLWLELVPIATDRWQMLLEAFRRHGLAIDVHRRYEIGQVERIGRFAAYEAQRSKNLRRSLRKDLQRLRQSGPLELKLYAQFTPEEVERRLREAFEIEQRSWKRDRGQAVLGVPGMFAFYRRQACRLAEWGQLRLALLEHAGRPVAFELGWHAKGVHHSFKVGHDEAYRRFGPGHLLRRLLLERLFERPEVEAIDFQGPMTEALAPWATRSYPIGRVLVAPPRLLSRALMAGYRTAAPILRRLRPGRRTETMNLTCPRDTQRAPLPPLDAPGEPADTVVS